MRAALLVWWLGGVAPVALAAPAALLGLSSLTGCGATTMRVASLDEVERVRATDATRDAAARAPEVYARAEQERDFARAAHAAGDDVAANLHAERAMAAYGHAGAVARLARAIANLTDAQKALDDATAQEQSLAASRAKLDLEAQELERRAEIARSRLLPAASGEAVADREAARLAASRSLTMEARLLCGAARLVGAQADGLAEAESEVDRLEAQLRSPPAPTKGGARAEIIDAAGLARARCLDVLTRARRTAGHDDGGADALLSELSASGGWDPTRDERGVVVTLRGTFHGHEADRRRRGEAREPRTGRGGAPRVSASRSSSTTRRLPRPRTRATPAAQTPPSRRWSPAAPRPHA